MTVGDFQPNFAIAVWLLEALYWRIPLMKLRSSQCDLTAFGYESQVGATIRPYQFNAHVPEIALYFYSK
jgi:hypothetical protein